MKTERDFLKELEAKSKEQGKLARTELIPNWAKGVGDWLVIHPWRVLIPIATILYLLLRVSMGTLYREFILGLFGGFVR